MKPKVYVETTIVSYLSALPSRDIVVAAHQELTREWWARRERFDLFVSRPVWDETAPGDAEAAAKRLAALEGIHGTVRTSPMRRFKIEQACRAAGMQAPIICTPEELTEA